MGTGKMQKRVCLIGEKGLLPFK